MNTLLYVSEPVTENTTSIFYIFCTFFYQTHLLIFTIPLINTERRTMPFASDYATSGKVWGVFYRAGERRNKNSWEVVMVETRMTSGDAVGRPASMQPTRAMWPMDQIYRWSEVRGDQANVNRLGQLPDLLDSVHWRLHFPLRGGGWVEGARGTASPPSLSGKCRVIQRRGRRRDRPRIIAAGAQLRASGQSGNVGSPRAAGVHGVTLWHSGH